MARGILRPGPRDRGFALLIVLWALVPAALMFLTLAATARSDLQSATDLREAAVLEAAADGAINTVIFDMLATRERSTGEPGERVQRLRMPGADVAVNSTGLSGLVNPNSASPELLAALMVRLGASDAQARLVAGAMVDWRTPGQKAGVNGAKAAEYQAAGLDYGPPGAPFESIDELGLVLGMTPLLLAAAEPTMSLYAYGEPDPRTAAPPVRGALADIGRLRGSGTLDTQVIEITASATGSGGGHTVRQAIIRFGPGAARRDWRVLTWETRSGL